jgi:hypothetical protein
MARNSLDQAGGANAAGERTEPHDDRAEQNSEPLTPPNDYYSDSSDREQNEDKTRRAATTGTLGYIDKTTGRIRNRTASDGVPDHRKQQRCSSGASDRPG